MTGLALETSCDETAVAILRGADSRYDLLASEVASQVAAHEKYGGIVPEIASRNHLIYAPRLLDRATSAAKFRLSEINAFAATGGPGLASSLMIGASIAKGLSIGFGKPYLAINHLEGHLLSPFFRGGEDGENEIRSNVSLIVSGGHTMMVLVRGLTKYHLIGRTVDDAAGEAFDKVAKCSGSVIPAALKLKNARETEIPNVLICPQHARLGKFQLQRIKNCCALLAAESCRAVLRNDGRGAEANTDALRFG